MISSLSTESTGWFSIFCSSNEYIYWPWYSDIYDEVSDQKVSHVNHDQLHYACIFIIWNKIVDIYCKKYMSFTWHWYMCFWVDCEKKTHPSDPTHSTE